MAAMSAGAGDRHSRVGATTAEEGSALEHRSRSEASATVRGSIWFLEHMQDVATVAVGIILIALAGVVLVSSIVDSLDGTYGSVSAAAPKLLDNVLLVLIVVEIVYTVVLSLRAHRLVAQPFIVVGLIAVIRRILFVFTPGSGINASPSELAILIGMVAVFVASLIAVNHFEKNGQD
jgi:uncharacterized membrane protein (DUF373 family)